RTRGSVAATLSTDMRVHIDGGVSLSAAAMHAAPFGTGLIGETVNGLPARAWDYGLDGAVDRSETAFAMYGSAQGRLFGTIDMDAGLRLEHVSGRARNAPSGVAWTSFEPRLVLRYSGVRWSGFLSARRYHPTLSLTTLAAGDPAGPYGPSYLWNDRN